MASEWIHRFNFAHFTHPVPLVDRLGPKRYRGPRSRYGVTGAMLLPSLALREPWRRGLLLRVWREAEAEPDERFLLGVPRDTLPWSWKAGALFAENDEWSSGSRPRSTRRPG